MLATHSAGRWIKGCRGQRVGLVAQYRQGHRAVIDHGVKRLAGKLHCVGKYNIVDQHVPQLPV